MRKKQQPNGLKVTAVRFNPETSIGAQCREVRKMMGVTLRELSERTGFGLSNISHFENDSGTFEKYNSFTYPFACLKALGVKTVTFHL